MNTFLLPPYLAAFSSSFVPAMKRFALGILCLAVYAVFGPYFPDNYYLTDEYEVRLCSNKITITVCDTSFPHYLNMQNLVLPTGAALLVSLCVYSALGQNQFI